MRRTAPDAIISAGISAYATDFSVEEQFFMERIIMNDLLKWRNKKKHKPLLLLGVRQCGKTYTAKEFGETHFEDVAYFNFKGNIFKI